ncbi:MAG TPA: proprotein convertase P-domain-containing protein [Gemmataceae bacterium]|nr:proprotein convertase P-domain-containing protein [Gemmataceae bacterium]
MAASRPHRRAALTVRPLEDRSVPTGLPPTVLVGGPAQVAEFGTYRLDLTAVDPEGDPVSEWTINWGDSTVTTHSGNPTSVTHTYGAGPVVQNVTATATVGGESFPAAVSGVGAFRDVFISAASGGLNDPWLIDFGRDLNGDGTGDLYVTGRGSNNLAAYDGQTGAFLGNLISAANGLNQPQSLAVGPDGSLYVGSDLVLKYDWATGVVSTFIPTGSAGLDQARGLTFGPDANADGNADLYLHSYSGGAGQVLRFDGVTGAPIGSAFITNAGFFDMTFGPDGHLYGTNPNANSVRRFHGTTGAFIDDFVAPNIALMDRPEGLAFGPDGDLYVASQFNDRVLRYDGSNGTYLGTVTGGGLDNPMAVAFGPDGDLYVSSRYTNSVLRYAGPLTANASTAVPVTVLDAVTATYSSGNINKAIPSDLRYYSWTINVPDSGPVLDVDVTVNITHSNVGDLDVLLVSPAGTTRRLFHRVGGTGDNFVGTIMDDEAAVSIADGTAPFTGRFRLGPPLEGSAIAGPLSDFDWEHAKGNWTLQISDRSKPVKGTLNSWAVTIARGVGPAPLLAAHGPATDSSPAPLTQAQLRPIVAEAVRRWNLSGLTPAEQRLLKSVQFRIAELDGATIGRAAGTTVTLGATAAGHGWFADPTPRSDSEFIRKGDQGEQGRMDLLTAVTHELGHVLGREHGDGAMAETLTDGTRESLVPAVRVGNAAVAKPAFGPGWFLSSGRARR